MTLTELRYIVALARERHFGKAASACHISQPTLSVAISKLEAELGVAIFERDRQDLRLTELGEKIIVQAQKTLDEAAHIKEIAYSCKENELTTPLRLGAIFTIAPYLFPHLIPALREVAPKMPLLIQEDFTANLRIKLQQGDLDAIFIALPFSGSNIVTKALYDEPFVILMRKDHPLSHKEKISAAELPEGEMLLLGEGHCFRQQVLEVCPHCYSGDFQNTVEGTSLETLRHMIASGLGITVLPSSATEIDYYSSILCTRPFEGAAPKRRVALAWRASFTRTRAIDALIAALNATQQKGTIPL